MRTAEGLEYFRRLIAKTDIFWENNVPETIEKLHVTYEELVEHNPKLIMLRAPAFGLTGPYKNRRGFGVHIEAFIGHTVLRGYRDMDPSSNTEIYAGDYLTAANGVFAVLAALHHRDLTGKGQLIELAQAENSSQMFPQSIMDYILNGRISETLENRDVQGYAPNGVYRCAGEDRWLALTVTDDTEWAALCEVMERPDLVDDARFVTAADREANQDALDAIVGDFCAKKDHIALMYRLQEAGVPAGAVLDPRDGMHSAQLWGRDFWYRIPHGFTGTYEWPGPPLRIPTHGVTTSLTPNGLAEHKVYV
jgi:crotonobetainyl-CoA:carnitine CoA-transferase CaiB-like acyl-CoA transferase